MHLADYLVFSVYFVIILGVGFYFYRKNTSSEDFYVGGRTIRAGHIGMSIAATDVGGGFSIGLGGLGFSMGLAGTWLLFTGLVGAWLAAVFTVPLLKKLDLKHGLLTFPDFLALRYNKRVAALAAFISGIGYLGFTAGQILAGGKLAAASIFSDMPGIDPLHFSLIVMTLIVVLYTVMGGLKAVVYTDTVQWIVLLAGLLFLGFPFAYHSLGGWSAISNTLPDTHFSLLHIAPVTVVNWAFSIVPIWFIAMTLYQRVYASPDVKQARKAFFIAGIFEYPILAFVGVGLGMLARVAFPLSDPESALPLLLTNVLPIGIAGFVVAAYFSAIMSTADSCLIASSGNFLNDIIPSFLPGVKSSGSKQLIRQSQLITLLLGLAAFLLATYFTSVLDIVLQSYAFMVSGLLVPTLAAYFSRHTCSRAALVSMLGGGGTTLVLIFAAVALPYNLDATVFGISASLILYSLTYWFSKR